MLSKRNIFILILIIFIVLMVVLPIIFWKESGFILNFWAELFGVFAGSLGGAVFTYFVIDYLNENRFKKLWVRYEVDLKSELYRFFVNSIAGILFGNKSEGLLYKNYSIDLVQDCFDGHICQEYNDLMPKVEKLYKKLKEFYKNPEEVKINLDRASAYSESRKNEYDSLKEEFFKHLPMLYWLNDMYKDFVKLNRDIKDLKNNYEIYANHINETVLPIHPEHKIMKIKKQYIYSVLIFLNQIINFNKKYELYTFSNKKSNVITKSIEKTGMLNSIEG